MMSLALMPSKPNSAISDRLSAAGSTGASGSHHRGALPAHGEADRRRALVWGCGPGVNSVHGWHLKHGTDGRKAARRISRPGLDAHGAADVAPHRVGRLGAGCHVASRADGTGCAGGYVGSCVAGARGGGGHVGAAADGLPQTAAVGVGVLEEAKVRCGVQNAVQRNS